MLSNSPARKSSFRGSVLEGLVLGRPAFERPGARSIAISACIAHTSRCLARLTMSASAPSASRDIGSPKISLGCADGRNSPSISSFLRDGPEGTFAGGRFRRMEADDQWCLSAGPALSDILGPVSNKGGIGARGRLVRHMTRLIVGKPRAAIAQWRTPYDIDNSQRVRPDPVWLGANSNGTPGVASGQTICGGRARRLRAIRLDGSRDSRIQTNIGRSCIAHRACDVGQLAWRLDRQFAQRLR